MSNGMRVSSPFVASRIRGLVGAVILFSVFSNLLMLTGPLFMLQVYDRVLVSRSEETLVALLALVSILYFTYWLIEFARGRVAARAGIRVQDTFDAYAFKSVFEGATLRTNNHLGSPIQALNAIRAFFSSPVFLALLDLPWAPLFMVCIFVFHPMLGWLATAGGTLLIALALFNQAVTRRQATEASRLATQADRFANQTEAAGEFVIAQGMEQAVTERWKRLRDTATDQSLRVSDWTGSISSLIRAFRLFLQSAILALGAWLVLQSEITAGAMVAVAILMARALAPVEQCVAHWATVQNARTGWAIVQQLIREPGERVPPLDLPRPDAHLSVENVTVPSPRRDAPVLRQISFAISPGDALGVIGKSGSGKTTLARVIVGLVTPAIGDVRLNGATLDQFGSDRLGHYIGYLPQELQFFDGTIAENIAQMTPDPDPKKVVDAAQQARVHDIILELPKGYDTPIGDRVAHLSGGQKQRLALARALFHDPVLLVLDEPNSALDADGSDALNEVVRSMQRAQKAVLIMTHRPTAISACDRLLVLDKGAVAAFGPRDDILKSMLKNAGDVQRAIRRSSAVG